MDGTKPEFVLELTHKFVLSAVPDEGLPLIDTYYADPLFTDLRETLTSLQLLRWLTEISSEA